MFSPKIKIFEKSQQIMINAKGNSMQINADHHNTLKVCQNFTSTCHNFLNFDFFHMIPKNKSCKKLLSVDRILQLFTMLNYVQTTHFAVQMVLNIKTSLRASSYEEWPKRMGITVKYRPCDTNLLGLYPGEIYCCKLFIWRF